MAPAAKHDEIARLKLPRAVHMHGHYVVDGEALFAHAARALWAGLDGGIP